MSYATFQLPYFSDHKARLKSFIFSKIESAPYNAVRLMCESGYAFSPRTNFMWYTVLFI